MKLVDTDNFGRDYPDEKFYNHIPDNISKEDAEKIAAIVNRYGGSYCPRYCKVVENDYVLDGPFEP